MWWKTVIYSQEKNKNKSCRKMTCTRHVRTIWVVLIEKKGKWIANMGLPENQAPPPLIIIFPTTIEGNLLEVSDKISEWCTIQKTRVALNTPDTTVGLLSYNRRPDDPSTTPAEIVGGPTSCSIPPKPRWKFRSQPPCKDGKSLAIRDAFWAPQ